MYIIQIRKQSQKVEKSMKSTINKWVLNAMTALNLTQYSESDTYTIK